MTFTARFFYLLGAGLLPLFLSGFLPHIAGVALLYDALLLVAAAYDYFVTVPRQGVEIARECEHILSIGVHQPVTLSLRNLSERMIRLTVKDSPPVSFEREGHTVGATLAPGTQARHTYTVRPISRGVFEFGNVYYRLDGRLGLTRARFGGAAP